MIKRLRINNFTGVALLDVELTKTNLFCGDNNAGKSSIQQALRYVLTGEIERVKMKGDYGKLVKEGNKQAVIEAIDSDGVDYKTTISEKGKRTGESGDVLFALPYLLDQSRFAEVSTPELRKEFLYLLTNPVIDNDVVLKRVHLLGGNIEAATSVLPLLQSGFSVAKTECDDKGKMFKKQWETVTGEKYGDKKADDWQPTDLIFDDHRALAKLLKDREKTLADTHKELVEFTPQYQQTKAVYEFYLNHQMKCGKCGSAVKAGKDEVELLKEKLDDEAKTLDFLENAYAQASELYEQSKAADDFIKEKVAKNDEVSALAKSIHDKVNMWLKLAEIFSPMGLPSYFITPTVKALNERLAWSATVTGWMQPRMTDAGDIECNGRPYMLLSESEKWRATAMVVEALSELSGVKLFTLDRVDMLSPKQRIPLLNWVREIDSQVLMFATLKAKPSIPNVSTHWIASGEEQFE